tara:strand:+ start:10703 stop:11860 length:1158 start_codon:yes stop_codon:yes gene_type:complete
MAWTFPVLRILGTQLRVHVTFFLLLAWVGIATYAQSGWEGAVYGIAFILALFVCVILHEFGHALAAKAFGISTPDITLLPIGGLARLQRMPRDPIKELVIALAGPAVNVVIAGLIFLFLRISTIPLAIDLEARSISGFFVSLMAVNVWLVIFNMIPAFPMDGGRALRALLATAMPHSRATNIAARIGQALALGGVFVGFMNQWWLLVLVAFFIFLGAGAEASASRLREATRGLAVSDAMMTRFKMLRETDPISKAVDLLLDGSQTDFPILDDRDELSGMVLRKDLINALRKHSGSAAVVEARSGCEFAVAADSALPDAMQILQESQRSTIPVMSGGRLIGLLSTKNIGEMLMVKAAKDERRRSHEGELDAGEVESGQTLIGGHSS